MVNTHPRNAYKQPFLCISLFPMTPVAAGVAARPEELLERKGFGCREDGEDVAGRESALHLLPPRPGLTDSSPPGRERVEVADRLQGQKERRAPHKWGTRKPTCTQALSDMLKLKSKQHESTLYYS